MLSVFGRQSIRFSVHSVQEPKIFDFRHHNANPHPHNHNHDLSYVEVIMSKRKSRSTKSTSSSSSERLSKRRKKVKVEDGVRTFANTAGSSESLEMEAMDETRMRFLTMDSKEARIVDGEVPMVLYWMSRDQRAQDNWALVHAYQEAKRLGGVAAVAFCLQSSFLGATMRHFGFMLKGLAELEGNLRKLNIPFYLLEGAPEDAVPTFVSENSVSSVVCDFSPLRIGRKWRTDLAELLDSEGVPCIEVDAHNIVPIWVTSKKQEYAARTIRPKIHRHLNNYTTEFPPIVKQDLSPAVKKSGPGPVNPRIMPPPIDWDRVNSNLQCDKSVKEVPGILPGEAAAKRALDSFLNERLKSYGKDRNDPNKSALSGLSPYFHFGMLAPQRAVMEANQYRRQYGESVATFVEESVVRRELSDNFCLYNKNYDSIKGCSDWARISLNLHKKDKREYLYTLKQFEYAVTHDDLWNAAQLQMTREGKMHGFLRMYWAKKILEWTESAEQALEFAIYLNDRYELDGRDPSGYVGCMWSIGGIHDRGWTERSVFGKIRFMNYKGCKRKFNVDGFVKNYPGAIPGSKIFRQNKKMADTDS